jgi:hypothetical protein
MYPKECKPRCNKDTCTPMFIAALYTIASYGNIYMYIYICTYVYVCTYIKEYYSAIKNNELMLFPGK